MDRTSGADNVDIGGGKRGFRDENRAAGLIGTEVDALWTNSIQEELMAVIEDAGLVADEGDWTQLLQAINKKIESVRVNQPIYPHILTTDGKLTLTSPVAGTIRIGAGTQFVMRGGETYTTVQTNLVTAPSKIYHLRFRRDTKTFALQDLASLTYNPTAIAETVATFDSGYDDMLAARVTTSAGNVATIKTLVNKPKLIVQTNRRDVMDHQLNWASLAGSGTTLDWSRTPDVVNCALNEWASNNIDPDGVAWTAPQGHCVAVGMRVPAGGVSRYAISALEYYYEDDVGNQGVSSAILLAMAL